MLLQAPLLHGVALHINSRLHKNGPDYAAKWSVSSMPGDPLYARLPPWRRGAGIRDCLVCPLLDVCGPGALPQSRTPGPRFGLRQRRS